MLRLGIILISCCVCVRPAIQLGVGRDQRLLTIGENKNIVNSAEADTDRSRFDRDNLEVNPSVNGTPIEKSTEDNNEHKSDDSGVIVPVIRRKRAEGGYLTDHGYGSRMLAGQNMAKDMAVYGGVYGKYGPGKRTTATDDGRKRYVADNGYGSRVDAGSNMANSMVTKDGVFGSYGPGKRSRWLDGHFGLNTKPTGNFFTDNGYGSRIDTGSALARDVVAVGDLFGRFGPGRRKRTERENVGEKHEEVPEVIVVVGEAEE